MLHDLPPAAKGADGQAAADDLAERGEVRLHAILHLCPANAEAVTGDHFIEDQEHVMGFRDLPDLPEVVVLRQDRADVAEHRFDDECGNIVVGREKGFQRFGIIVGHLPRVGHEIGKDPGRVRDTHRCCTGPAFTSTASWAPWNPPSIFTISFFPVNPRASRIAAIVASDPLETNRTMSMPG